jgi:hypothetical protein
LFHQTFPVQSRSSCCNDFQLISSRHKSRKQILILQSSETIVRSAMEGIDSNWDENLHDSLHFAVDALGHPESIAASHAYDLELGSGLWGTQSVGNSSG